MTVPSREAILDAINAGPEPAADKWLIDEMFGKYVPFRVETGYHPSDRTFDTFDAAKAWIERLGGELL